MLERALLLVLAVYRVTRLFPEGEVLIGQMRGTANQVLTDLVLRNKKEVSKQIEVLLNYFQIAQAQNWTRSINFVILNKEYQKLLDEIKIVKIKGLNQRQKKILEQVKNFKQFRLGELDKYFPKTSPRTLSRDLDQICLKGYLIKKGHGRGAFYKIRTK